MNPVSLHPTSVFEQATDWFIRLRSVNATADDLTDWLNWIEADPAHRAAFDQVQDIWHVTGAIEPSSLISPDAAPSPDAAAGLSGAATHAPAPAAPLRPHPNDFADALLAPDAGRTSRQSRAHVRTPRPAWIGLGMAACLIAAAALPGTTQFLARGWYVITDTATQRIASAHAQPRTVQLPDGSYAQLGADTHMQLRFTPQQRLVETGEGEVFYRVRHNAQRPFVVQAGSVSVTAIGTAFSVRREAGTVSVVVVEGAVDVKTADAPAPLRAAAGQRVRFDQSRRSSDTLAPVQNDPSVGWASGRLLFQDDPLRVVVASLNRYAHKPIVLADPTLAELRFTGTVFEGRTHDWISAVERLFPVDVEETSDRVVLKRRD